MAKLLIINLGSTSTKIALFEDTQVIKQQTLRHSSDDLKAFAQVLDQLPYRKAHLESWLNDENIQFSDIDLLVARGAIVKPLPGGVYAIDQDVYDDVSSEKYGSHVSNVGILITYQWHLSHKIPAVYVDPPSTDELQEVARITGVKGIYRRSAFHALNQKQITKRYAHDQNTKVQDLNLIVAHLGGGISVGAHQKGHVIDVTNALDGEGPLSPERSGELPNFSVLDASTQDSIQTLKKRWAGQSGLVSHLQTNNMQEALELAKSDAYAALIIDTMVYQIAKAMGAMATVLYGQVDQILITGGLAYSTEFVQKIIDRVAWIAPVSIYPGEDELAALAQGAMRYLRGQESLKKYQK
jgi:butyrate kinase